MTKSALQPTSDVRTVVEEFFTRWNKGDREGWLDLLAKDVRHEEPVGADVRFGPEPFAEMWDYAQAPGTENSLVINLLIACGREAAVHFTARNVRDGKTTEMDVIEIWTVDDQGKLAGVRAFVDPDAFAGAVAT